MILATLLALLQDSLAERLASDDLETYDAAVAALAHDKDKSLRWLLEIESPAEGDFRRRVSALIDRFAEETAGFLVFAADAKRGRKIVLHAAGGTTSELEMKQSGAVAYPIVSPDGRRMAFFDWTRDVNLCVADIDGRNARRIAKGVHESWLPAPLLGWKPDGTQVLARMSRDGGKRVGVVAIDIDTGAETLVTDEAVAAAGWTPRGDVWTISRKQPSTVRIRSTSPVEIALPEGTIDLRPTQRGLSCLVDGQVHLLSWNGAERRIVEWEGVQKVERHAWSPDGSTLAFVRRGEIFVLRENARVPERIYEVPLCETLGEHDPMEPHPQEVDDLAFARSGQHLALSVSSNHDRGLSGFSRRLHVVSVRSRKLTSLTEPVTGGMQIRWTP